MFTGLIGAAVAPFAALDASQKQTDARIAKLETRLAESYITRSDLKDVINRMLNEVKENRQEIRNLNKGLSRIEGKLSK